MYDIYIYMCVYVDCLMQCLQALRTLDTNIYQRSGYMYIYIYIYTCMHTYIYIYIYTHAYIHL